MKKKYYVLYLGVIFLMLDIMIKVFPFPAFEEFFTLAPETVDMVINHVVGDRMRLDVASDFIGLILIFLGSRDGHTIREGKLEVDAFSFRFCSYFIIVVGTRCAAQTQSYGSDKYE